MNIAATRACAWVSFGLLTYAPLASGQSAEIIAGARDFLNVPGTSVATAQQSMTVGPDGNLYVLEYARNLVRYRVSDGTVTTMPGNPDLPPLDFYTPYSIAFDSAGVAHVMTYEGLYRVDLVAGTKTLLGPVPNPGFGTAFGHDGSLYWTSVSDNRIRARLPSGEIRVIAGNDVAGFGGDGGPAELATLNRPDGLAIAPNGDVYFSDQNNNRVRRISADTGIITTVFGTGATSFTPDGLPAAQTNVSPGGLAFDTAGNLFVVTALRVRRVDAVTSIVTTVAGSGSFTFSGDGGPATAAGISPWRLAVDLAGNIFVQDFGNYRIRRVDAATGIITTVMGNGKQEYCGENVPARSACIGYVRGIDIEANGNLLISDEHGYRVRRVSKDTGNIVTLMNPVPIPGDPAGATQIPVGVEHDPAGNVYVTTESHRVWKLDSTGAPTFFAGTGQQGFSGDGGLAGTARLNTPADLAFDAAGNAFIADTFNNRIRRVDAATRVITTYAGNGTNTGALGDGGSATAATVTFPQTVEVDPQGNLLIGETGGCIRRVDRVTRVISTIFNFTGNQCVSTFPPGTFLLLGAIGKAPAFTFDRLGNLWFMYGSTLRRMDYATNVITVVPSAVGGAFRAEGRAINTPSALEFDSLGRLLVGDKIEMRVFRISGLSNTVPDSTPPVITPQVSGQAGANGWHVGDVTVSFSVTDAESAITSQQGCGASSVTQDTGGVTFTCTATSTGGTAIGSATIRRDATAPKLDFGGPIPAANANGWNGSDVSLSFTATDDTSGVASTSVPSPLAFSNEGMGMTQSVTVTDVAGNAATFVSTAVSIDKTPPVISPDVTGTPGNNGWHIGNVHVGWSINEIPTSIESSTGCDTTAIPADTAGTLFTCSVTSAGGTSSSSTTVKVDSTAPSLSFGVPTPAANAFGWHNSDVSIPFTTSDVTSGIASTSAPNPLTFTNEGVGVKKSVTVTDAAGNSATFESVPLNIDKTPPIVAPVVTGTLGNNGWYRGDTTVEWSINEMPASIRDTSGCGTSTVTTDTAGVMFSCTVNSGGGGTTVPVSIKRDATPPQLQWGAFTPIPNANGWNKTNVSVPFTRSDALSGLASTSTTSPLVISTEGAGVAGQVTVTDLAGNSTTFTTAPRNIDKTAPYAEMESPIDGATYGFYADVIADFVCEDISLASCTAPVANGAMVSTTTAGSRTFKVTAKDLAGFTTNHTHTFTVASGFNFDGFLAPARAPTTLNLVTRGSLVPVRWRLPDGRGGFVSNPASFVSATVATFACSGGTVALNDTASGPAGLGFDAASGTFTYNWETSAGWTGCRKLTIKLKDNSTHELRFKFQ